MTEHLDIEAKQALISRSTALIDEHLQTTMVQLTANTDLQLKELSKMLTTHHERIRQQIEELQTTEILQPAAVQARLDDLQAEIRELKQYLKAEKFIQKPAENQETRRAYYRSPELEEHHPVSGQGILIVFLLLAVLAALFVIFIHLK